MNFCANLQNLLEPCAKIHMRLLNRSFELVVFEVFVLLLVYQLFFLNVIAEPIYSLRQILSYDQFLCYIVKKKRKKLIRLNIIEIKKKELTSNERALVLVYYLLQFLIDDDFEIGALFLKFHE